MIDMEIINCILSNLPEEYKIFVKNLQEWLYDSIDLSSIKKIRDKLLANYNIMTAWSNKKE